MFWETNAYAMAGGAGAGGSEAGMMNMAAIGLMFAVFYFLLIRPQQKRAKEHQNMLGNVKRGDEVVTAGGLHGRVLETAEQYLIVDLGETKVKLSRSAVSAVLGQPKATDKPAKKTDKPQLKKADKDASADEALDAAQSKDKK